MQKIRPPTILIAGFLAGSAAEETLPIRGGIHRWAAWRPSQISREDYPELRGVPLILHWNKLEPAPGNYRFDRYLGEPLRTAESGRRKRFLFRMPSLAACSKGLISAWNTKKEKTPFST